MMDPVVTVQCQGSADTHLLSSDQDGNMDIWMIYYRQTLTWKLGEVRITTISQDNLHLASDRSVPLPVSGLASSYSHSLSSDLALSSYLHIVRTNCSFIRPSQQYWLPPNTFSQIFSVLRQEEPGEEREPHWGPGMRGLSISQSVSQFSPDAVSHFSVGL